MVLEAAGKDEATAGRPVVGKAGHFTFTQLGQVGLSREDFRIHNVLSCRPPDNKLAGMWYESAAIQHCSPNLNSTIESHKLDSRRHGKTPVILALGRVAFKRVMELQEGNPILKQSYLTYPHRRKDGVYVIASNHPAFLLRGKQNLIGAFQGAAKRALEIASQPEYKIEDVRKNHLCDPNPYTFGRWVDAYVRAWEKSPDETFLAYDIETPYKSGKDEEDVAREEDSDYTILRVSFAYQPGFAVSVPWTSAYMPYLRRIFRLPSIKVGWNSENYDDPRVAYQMPLMGTHIDAMLAWHVLNSSLPKGLGFVTPFYCPDHPMWKHINNDEPALYNAIDSDVTLRDFLGIRKDLIAANLWSVFERHVIELNRVLTYMRTKGVLLDNDLRKKAEVELSGRLGRITEEMEAVIPETAKQYKIYKREPGDTSGMVKRPGLVTERFCSACGGKGVLAAHYRSIGKKRLKAKESENPCLDGHTIKREVEAACWAKPLPFKVSAKSLTRYQEALEHKPVRDRKTKKVVFNKTAMKTLVFRYPKDVLYPSIERHRKVQKLLGTYIGREQEDGRVIGGMPVDRDGRVRTLFTHNPSTLRLASQNPNLQNLPRPGGKNDLETMVRTLIVAAPGHVLHARDFSGIEAVLVGYEAQSKDYIRLAKMDVHSFYTAYALHETTGALSANDLPLVSWDDDKLRTRLAEIKREFKHERNALYKHLVHAINFGQTAKGAREKIYEETDVLVDLKDLHQVMGVYMELFPLIPKWHDKVKLQAHKERYLRNAFGYVHKFFKVYDWQKVGGRWQTRPGPDSSKALAFHPQSNAAGYHQRGHAETVL